EEPNPVRLDRPADAHVVVPQLQQCVRCGQTARPQILRVVAAHHSRGYAGEVYRTLDGVAAGLRHDAECRSSDFRLAQTAGGGHRHFGRVADVGHVARDAGAVERGSGHQAIDLQTAFVVASAGPAEHEHTGCDL